MLYSQSLTDEFTGSRFVYRSTLLSVFQTREVIFRVCSVLKGNVVYACLKYPSSAIFQQISAVESDLFLSLGIIYSGLRHQFVIFGSVAGRAILSSAENYGQSFSKLWVGHSCWDFQE